MKKILWLFLFALLFSSVPAFSYDISKDLAIEIKQKEAAVKTSPSDPFVHFDLAMTYACSNKIVEGLDQLKKVQALNPNYAPIAVNIFKKKLAANPNDWQIRFRLAFAQYVANQQKDSINNFQLILKQDPGNIWAMAYMGLAYGGLNQYDKAIVLFQQALKQYPGVSSIHYALGEAYERKGDSWKGFQEKAEAMRLKMLGQ
ncbi:MAG: tetratricopeptide repeat protein [bacterium]